MSLTPTKVEAHFKSRASRTATKLQGGLPARAAVVIFKASRPAVGPKMSTIQWVPGIKQPVCKAPCSYPSNGEIQNEWSCISNSR